MDRIARVLAALTLTAVAGGGLAGCSAGDRDQGAGGTDAPTVTEASGAETSGAATATTMTTPTTPTTTSSAPVPGPAGNPVDIPAPVADRWNELGGEAGSLGRVAGPATDVAGGSVVDFERGTIVLTPGGRAFVVQGEILSAYRDAGGPAGELGFPTADEATTDGGWISTFEGGVITYLDGRPAVELR